MVIILQIEKKTRRWIIFKRASALDNVTATKLMEEYIPVCPKCGLIASYTGTKGNVPISHIEPTSYWWRCQDLTCGLFDVSSVIWVPVEEYSFEPKGIKRLERKLRKLCKVGCRYKNWSDFVEDYLSIRKMPCVTAFHGVTLPYIELIIESLK